MIVNIERSRLVAVCYLLTWCREREGAYGSKGREEVETDMHDHMITARPVNKERENNTHRGAVASLSTADVMKRLVLVFLGI